MLVVGAVMLALAMQAAGSSAATVKETAYARVGLAQSIARDPAIHRAVAASNALTETPDDIRKKDAAWIANKRDPRRQVIVKAPCSDRVRDLVKADPVVVEAFVMNDRGTLVCSIAETSDYWQGDEAKWQRTYLEGREAFVEEPAFDASSGTYAIQVSVPVSSEANKRIGAVTLTLKLRRDTANH
jgi:hypothetical protein